MSTAEAIRIGTATTGRLITAAALVLAVVAGSFIFSDLVMMKYLAFGSDGGAVAGRHRGPDVPGAVGDEAARRRLLVGAALDEASAESSGARRDRPTRRAQGAVGAGPGCAARRQHPPAGHGASPPAARPHAPQCRGCAAPGPAHRAAAARTSARRPAPGQGCAAVGCGNQPDDQSGPAAERGCDDALFGPAEPVGRPRAGAPARSPAKPAWRGPGDRVLAERPAWRKGRRLRDAAHRSRPPRKPAHCRFRRGTSRLLRRPTSRRKTPPPRSRPHRARTRTPIPPPRS